MDTNADYTRDYFDIINSLNGDVASRRAAYNYIQSSTAIVHRRIIDSSFVPRLFNQKTYDVMKQTAETMHRILCRVITRYLDDESYRSVFHFDPRIAELILLPGGYDSILPFARVDTFLNEDTYEVSFCELNGDGSAGLNENREVTNAIKNSATMREFAANHHVQGCNLFLPWVDHFLRIYDTYQHKVEHPRIAICDYLENGVVDEFYVFQRLFNERDVPCTVCDVRKLRFDGTALRDDNGERIDAVWRRSVTNDVLTFWDESQDFIAAVRAEKVALIGSFACFIVHDKQLFEVLYKPETHAFLTPEEIDFISRTIPQTMFLNDDTCDIESIRAHKDDWIIKPTDHYGADNVYAGCEVTQKRWEELIDAYSNERAGYPFLVQRYIVPFQTETLPPDIDINDLPDDQVSSTPKLYNNVNGLYLFDGVFQGVFSRMGPNPTVYKENEGMTAASMWVDTEVDAGCALDLTKDEFCSDMHTDTYDASEAGTL